MPSDPFGPASKLSDQGSYVFRAGFSSDCEQCGRMIHGGDPMILIDRGTPVHEECADDYRSSRELYRNVKPAACPDCNMVLNTRGKCLSCQD